MRKVILTIVALFSVAFTADAMTYEQARREALFLTDKMAYELNLTNEQYEAAYEINLDYLMGVTDRNDVFGTYWERRNLDMSYILLEWQWNAFRAASYFFRPLYWDAGCWHFGIYARYPRRHYLYFGRPAFYISYRGGHSWRMNGGHSYYHGRSNHFRNTGSRNHGGMRDGWNRGDFGRNSRHEGGSSTRVTVNKKDRSGSFGNRNIDHDGNRLGGLRSSGNEEKRIGHTGGNAIGNRDNIGVKKGNTTFSGKRNENNRLRVNTDGKISRPTANINTMRTNRNTSSFGTSRGTSSHRSSSQSAGNSRGGNGGGRFGGQR